MFYAIITIMDYLTLNSTNFSMSWKADILLQIAVSVLKLTYYKHGERAPLLQVY